MTSSTKRQQDGNAISRLNKLANEDLSLNIGLETVQPSDVVRLYSELSLRWPVRFKVAISMGVVTILAACHACLLMFCCIVTIV